MSDWASEMEALARASLMIRDLAKGIKGTVLIEAPAFVGVPSPEDIEGHERAVAEIHQGQLDMAAAGWHRAPDFLIEHMWVPHHNVERAAWFKDDHEKKQTDWIMCSITTRFGLRAVFTSEEDYGTRTLGHDEIRRIAQEHYERTNAC